MLGTVPGPVASSPLGLRTQVKAVILGFAKCREGGCHGNPQAGPVPLMRYGPDGGDLVLRRNFAAGLWSDVRRGGACWGG